MSWTPEEAQVRDQILTVLLTRPSKRIGHNAVPALAGLCDLDSRKGRRLIANVLQKMEESNQVTLNRVSGIIVSVESIDTAEM